MSDEISKQRTISEILLSLESKVNALMQIVHSDQYNNKLILDRLNKLVSSETQKPIPQDKSNTNVSISVESQYPVVELSQKPIATRNFASSKPTQLPAENISSATNKPNNKSKVPVVQRIKDQSGHDVFSADVIITNIATGEENRLKTNAVGKWQTYLGPGKYSVLVSKVIDLESNQKIEALQEIEIDGKTKSLQLPIAIINR